MMIYGNKQADTILAETKKSVEGKKLKKKFLAVLIGSDSASQVYLRIKESRAAEMGIPFELLTLPDTLTQEEIEATLQARFEEPKVGAVLVQMPMPAKYDADRIIALIPQAKDADGFHPENIKKYLEGYDEYRPVFAEALYQLVKSTVTKPMKEQRAVALVNSDLFGKTMTQVFKDLGILYRGYILANHLENQGGRLKDADIVVTACGLSGAIKGKQLKAGGIVIDGGMIETKKGVKGDIDTKTVEKVSEVLVPVPGGVGPVTVAVLMARVTRMVQ